VRAQLLTVSVLLVLSWTAAARAQSCHAPSLRPTDGLTYRAALTGSFASFDNAIGRGEYQGLSANFSVAQTWFVAEVALPTYRIAQVGSHAYGLGDLALAARFNVYQTPDAHTHSMPMGTLQLGPELAATLPTGDADKNLGMGHVMLMPGVFVQFQQAGWTVLAQVAYGRALGEGHAQHHDMGPMPLVNPMNQSELTHAIGVSASVHPNLRVSGRLLGAVHVFDHKGRTREILAPGLQLIAGAFDVSLEVQLPVVGDPFASRTLLSVGAQW
jgi:hypothetical protein